MNQKEPFVRPEVSVVDISGWAVVCDSPKPGGNEDVGYEDW